MKVPQEVERIARSRVEETQPQTETSLRMIRKGVPLAAEPDTERLTNRIQRKGNRSRVEAEALTNAIRALEFSDPKTRKAMAPGPEAIQGSTVDFVGVAFLTRGIKAARSVGRIAFNDGRPQGSGFIVGDRLLLTNKHVIPSKEFANRLVVEFDYELDETNNARDVTRYRLDPNLVYVGDEVADLDYALIGIGEKLAGPFELGDFSCCRLSDEENKHALGEVANIVQHPDGRRKEVVLRENRLVARLDWVLHYLADTEPGSSGSPVFNNEWQVIALHHWGGPFRQTEDDEGRAVPLEINEGIRISAIMSDLRQKMNGLSQAEKDAVASVFSRESVIASNGSGPARRNTDVGVARISKDGTATWSIPLEVSVRIPILSGAVSANGHAPAVDRKKVDIPEPPAEPAPEGLRPSTDYSDRAGYRANFISGFSVPLPQLSDDQKDIAAVNLQAGPGDDPFELKYHHFSIVMNRLRRLAFFTACNIDGKRAKHVDRDTGEVSPLEPGDPRLESLSAAEGAEASESWYNDERLNAGDFAGKDVYEKQKVPGFPVANSQGRILRMFQRGHLVRRMDPAWGTDEQAVLADADTFHWTNCSPQVGFFNMGRAPASTPGSGGGKLWRAIENYVLRNAVDTDGRVCSFTGPVFLQNDRKFRGIKVPRRFWKIVVWKENGALRSIAMIADQSKVIDVWPESLNGGEEAFGDADELEKVEDFITTVADIEDKTRLDFGADVRHADIFAGESMRKITSMEELKGFEGEKEYA